MNKKIHSLIKNHSEFLTLCGIFLLSFILRSLYYFLTDRISRDSFAYIDYAELLYKCNWDWSIVYTEDLMNKLPPLLTTVMTAGMEIGIDAKTSGVLFCMICGSLLPLGVYFCAVNIFKKRIYAYCAALLIAFHHYCIRVSADVLRDAPYQCFFVFALVSAIYAIKTGKKRFWIFFGVLSALTSLTRQEGVELLLIFFIWNIIALMTNGHSFKKRLMHVIEDSIIVIVSFAVITLPIWLIIRFTTDSNWSLFPLINTILEPWK